ncbi:MAG TPA: Fe-Mn family superoxide dismutase [Candidatus Baltobacteraceae bacterium]|nr:Fe-Mn family superoxide dismutase [Candidatus Baltobacteraceae bacterium]
MKSYTPKKWDLSGLQGISDATLETHFALYEGYVKNTNTLIELTTQARQGGTASGADPKFAELVRRMGWEFNGMRLHEYYFDNLSKGSQELKTGNLYNVLGESYGDFESWKKDFFAVGGMRGVGWAIAYYDPKAQQILNVWIEQHQNGNLAGYVPIVVMDCWEHAFIKDYKPSERGKYIEAFYANLNWQACEERLSQVRG